MMFKIAIFDSGACNVLLAIIVLFEVVNISVMSELKMRNTYHTNNNEEKGEIGYECLANGIINGIISHKFSCEKFVLCQNGIPYVKTCLPYFGHQTLFHPINLKCEHYSQVNHLCSTDHKTILRNENGALVGGSKNVAVTKIPLFVPNVIPKKDENMKIFKASPLFMPATTSVVSDEYPGSLFDDSKDIDAEHEANTVADEPPLFNNHHIVQHVAVKAVTAPHIQANRRNTYDYNRQLPSYPQNATIMKPEMVMKRNPDVPAPLPKCPPGSNGLFHHPSNCGQFMSCANGQTYIMNCAPGTLFNRRLGNCDFPWNVNCASYNEDFHFTTSNFKVTTATPSTSQDIFISASTSSPRLYPLNKMDTKQKQKESQVSTHSFKYEREIKSKTDVGIPNVTLAPSINQFPFAGFSFNQTMKRKQADQKKGTEMKRFKIFESDLHDWRANPDNKQLLRLRGGDKASEGFLQILNATSNDHELENWAIVCTEPNMWTAVEADVVCKQMGYENGVEQTWLGKPSSFPSMHDRRNRKYFKKFMIDTNVIMNANIKCSGNENILQNCQITNHTRIPCNLTTDTIWVRCFENSASKCRPDEVVFNNSCYILINPSLDDGSDSNNFTNDNYQIPSPYSLEAGFSKEEAAKHCSSLSPNSQLLNILSQKENDFLSEWLVIGKNFTSDIMTSGIGVSIIGNPIWIWEGTRHVLGYNNWWPGWHSSFSNNNVSDEESTISMIHSIAKRQKSPAMMAENRRAMCVIMRRLYPCGSEELESTSSDDNMYCDAQYFYWHVVDCGNMSRTHPYICKRPADPIGCVKENGYTYDGTANVTASKLKCLPWKSVPVMKALKNKLPHSVHARLLDSWNYCRNPDGSQFHPWCFVYSDIQSQNDQTPSSLQIKKEFCHIPTCAANSETATDGPSTNNSVLRLILTEGKTNTNPLLVSLADSISSLSSQNDESTMSRGNHSEQVMFACPLNSWKCENLNQCVEHQFLCDGMWDCSDGSDEREQLCNKPFQIRLTNGVEGKNVNEKTVEGRVEIKRYGIWGTVCDDDFGQNEATVICRSLGFSGIAEARKEAAFGPGIGPIWLDQVRCNGSENSLDDCLHSHWGQHNCKHNEDVSVICHTDFYESVKNNLNDDMKVEQLHRNGTVLPKLNAIFPENCGKILVNKSGGSIRGNIPWQASIRIRTSMKSEHWCGAVIITNWHLLTAAHCLTDYSLDFYFVRIGDYNLQVKESGEEDFNIANIYQHEHFKEDGINLNNDIAVVKIKGNMFFNEYIQPICLDGHSNERNVGLMMQSSAIYPPLLNDCVVSGWGSDGSPGSAVSNLLRSISVPILPKKVCNSDDLYGNKSITNGMFCAGFVDGGPDTCKGDSGGPLVCYENDTDINILYGVTSWGHGCGRKNKPGVYVNVLYYNKWIKHAVQISALYS